MTRSGIIAAALFTGLLAGCASSTQPVPPCCYQGDVTTTRLGALEVQTEDGRRLRFIDVFPGFTPQDGLFSEALPFDEVLREDIIYSSLEPLLPIYDANQDGRLERPEMVVLYTREAARATGTSVQHLLGDAPVWAVSAPNADVGGLVHWVKARQGSMSPEGQAIFRDLERLGLDLRQRGSEGGPNQSDRIRKR